MNKKIVIVILMSLIFMPHVKAECDSTRLNEIKNIAKNVEITYELDTELDKEKNYSVNKYGDKVAEGNMKIIISGLSSGLQIRDETYYRTISYLNSTDNVIVLNKEKNGNRTFKVYSNECGKSVRTISLKVPRYNEYSKDPLCKDIDSNKLKICGTWYEKEVDYDTFKAEVESYKQRLVEQEKQKKIEQKKAVFKKVKDFFINYYLYIIIGIVIIVSIPIIVKMIRKRSVLE